MKVYLLQHERELPEPGDVKVVGIYSNAATAERAIARLRDKPGLADSPEGFHIDEYELDEDHWTDGFV